MTALDRLIDALAKQAVVDYLTAQAAQQQALDAERPKPVPLPATDRAA